MAVSLTEETERLILQTVKEGSYGSPDEVVREALTLLEEQNLWRQSALELEDLRSEVARGVEQAEQGLVAPLDMEAIRAEVLRRATERRDRA